MSTNEPPQYPDSGSNPGWGTPGQGQQGGYGPPPGSPPPPAPGGYGYGYGYPQPQQSQKAMWSMIIGIISLLCCGLAGIASIIMGQQAKREIAESNGRLTGAGMAQAGFILGIIALVLTVIGIAFYVIVFAAAAGSGDF